VLLPQRHIFPTPAVIRVKSVNWKTVIRAVEMGQTAGKCVLEMAIRGPVPDDGVAPEGHHDAGWTGQAGQAGRLTMGSSLIGAMLSRVM
jgi:hypothetical protein